MTEFPMFSFKPLNNFSSLSFICILYMYMLLGCGISNLLYFPMEIADDLHGDFSEKLLDNFLCYIWIYVQFTFLWNHSKWWFGQLCNLLAWRGHCDIINLKLLEIQNEIWKYVVSE